MLRLTQETKASFVPDSEMGQREYQLKTFMFKELRVCYKKLYVVEYGSACP